MFNACATAASAIQQTADTIRLGKYDIGIAVGLDKHPRGAFTDDPAKLGAAAVVRRERPVRHHQVLRHEGQPATCTTTASPQETLAEVADKNFRNGALNPNAFRRKPISEEEILGSPMLNYPLTQYMFCAPDEGAAAVVMCRADIAHRYTDKPVYVRAVEIRTRSYGAYEVHATLGAARRGRRRRRSTPPRPPTRRRASAPRTSTSSSCRTPTPAPRSSTWPRTGFCADGEQEKLLADGATEIDGSMPVNTDGGLIANGEPIGASGLRQMHELVRQLRGEAGDRQVPGEPRVGSRPGLRRARHRVGDDPVAVAHDEPLNVDLRHAFRDRACRKSTVVVSSQCGRQPR